MNKYITLLLAGTLVFLVAFHLPQGETKSEFEIQTTAIYTLHKDANAYRELHGLKPVEIDARLMHSAQDKCEDMLEHNYWAHAREGKQFSDEIRSNGIYTKVGENLAKDYDYTQATQAWIDSEPHERNLLGDWSRVGYGICENKIVQHFAR